MEAQDKQEHPAPGQLIKAGVRLAAWQNAVGWLAAAVMALLWLVAGLYKLTNISDFQVKMIQLLVPVSLSLVATVSLAVTETFAGILLLRPAWRKLGGYLSVGLLLVFMAYVGINYESLQGEDCSCFPWIERAVGPGFFIGDGIMVVIAALAAVFAPAPRRLRGAAITLAGICTFAGVSLAWDRLGPAPEADVPAVIQVEGGEFNPREGGVFLFFFNPTCLHCLDAGIAMSELEWNAQMIGVPTQDFEIAPGFIEDTGLKDVKLTSDLELLKEKFPFEDVPYAVALRDGQLLEPFRFFEEPELSETLRKIEMVN